MEELGIPGMDNDESHHVTGSGTLDLRGLDGVYQERAVQMVWINTHN